MLFHIHEKFAGCCFKNPFCGICAVGFRDDSGTFEFRKDPVEVEESASGFPGLRVARNADRLDDQGGAASRRKKILVALCFFLRPGAVGGEAGHEGEIGLIGVEGFGVGVGREDRFGINLHADRGVGGLHVAAPEQKEGRDMLSIRTFTCENLREGCVTDEPAPRTRRFYHRKKKEIPQKKNCS